MLEFIKLLEGKKPSDIEIIPLNFTPREVSSVMSKSTLDLHYEKLARVMQKDTITMKATKTSTMQVSFYTTFGSPSLDKSY